MPNWRSATAIQGTVVKRFALATVKLFALCAVTAAVVIGVVRVGASWATTAAERPPVPTHESARLFVEPPPVEIATTTVGTFLGVRDEIALEHMRTQQIAEVRMNRGGSSISLRVTFADGSRAAFKPVQNNPQTVPRKEVAAYRINRLLGLSAVAPATLHTVAAEDIFGKLAAESSWARKRIEAETIFDDHGSTRGEISFWIPALVDSHMDTDAAVLQWTEWLTIGQEIPADKIEILAQLSTLLIFDVLQNNSDRFSGGNLLTSPDGKMLYFMDNTFGFQVEPEGHLKCREYLRRCQKFSRRTVENLRRLDLATLKQALDVEPGTLRDEEVKAVLARRDVVLKYIDQLIAANGEKRVLVFP